MAKQPVPPPAEWTKYFELGVQNAEAHFKFLGGQPAWFDLILKAYLCGFAHGIAKYGTQRFGARFIFNLMNWFADNALDKELPKGK